MRHSSLQRAQRIFVWLFFLAVVGIGIIAAQTAGVNVPVPATGVPAAGADQAGADQSATGTQPSVPRQGLVVAAWNKQVALISGHAGNDSGAVCEDENGQPTITEADINNRVALLTAERLRNAGADVAVLEEFDDRLQGLKVDVLLSIHADSCIDATGYKSSRYDQSTIPEVADRLVECINTNYGTATGLSENVNTITENMTEYHAFREIDPQTPAAILELGFLGGDHELLVHSQNVLAKGVADGILCFLQQPQ